MLEPHVPNSGSLARQNQLQRVLEGEDHNHQSESSQELFFLELGGSPPQSAERYTGFQLQLPLSQ